MMQRIDYKDWIMNEILHEAALFSLINDGIILIQVTKSFSKKIDLSSLCHGNETA
jgi:hypothetical protein